MNPPRALSVNEAWSPLPAREWSPAAARHLLRRTGWAATPPEAQAAFDRGLTRTIDTLFPAIPAEFPAPPLTADLTAETTRLYREARSAPTPEARNDLQRDLRERHRHAEQNLAFTWMQVAVDPARAALEKWVFFLGDVYVVSAEKVNRTDFVWQHFDLIRQHCLGPAPALTKAVSRSPAMVIYLDLQASRADAPNENFSRELFELFTLGEGNYTETDIKEAARAFAGYRQTDGVFRLAGRERDFGHKTIFGESRAFDGDGVIDLAYAQPAAATFLPRELLRFYVTDEPVDPAIVAELGRLWRDSGFNLRELARRVFSSRFFFQSTLRAAHIKSPLEFYLGLTQDLTLDVAPLPRFVLNSLRLMGQELFRPPNVRGWVGGRRWINSATLGARRQLVNFLLNPLDEPRFNADETAALAAARAAGRTRFTVDAARVAQIAELDDDVIVERFATFFLADAAEARRAAAVLIAHLAAATSLADRAQRIQESVTSLLQSPAYQLA